MAGPSSSAPRTYSSSMPAAASNASCTSGDKAEVQTRSRSSTLPATAVPTSLAQAPKDQSWRATASPRDQVSSPPTPALPAMPSCNLRHRHYEIAADQHRNLRLATAFQQLATAVERGVGETPISHARRSA